MPVWSKALHVVAAARTAAAGWRLRRNVDEAGTQRDAWQHLVMQLARTKFWSARGVGTGMTLGQFRSRVPLHTYAEIEPAVRRMRTGEADVLWPGVCRRYASTAGVEHNAPRVLPVTEGLLGHVRRASFDALALQRLRTGLRQLNRGHTWLCGSPAQLRAPEGEGAAVSTVGAAPDALVFPGFLAAGGFVSGECVARIPAWPAEGGTLALNLPPGDVGLIAGSPPAVVQIGRAQAASGHAWASLQCLVLGGVPWTPYADELRTLFGPRVQFHEIYAAAEAIIAAQAGAPGQGLRVLADHGVYFEFLPMSDFDAGAVAGKGDKTVPLADVATGVDYAIVLTTPGGLARHVLGDVVRFVARQPARLIYVGHTRLRLNGAGENLPESELTDALARLCRRRGWRTVHFHVAPWQESPSAPPRHEWWIELRAGTVETPMGGFMAPELDDDLQRVNPCYSHVRQSGRLAAPIVRLVMPGVFEQWLRATGRWDGHLKFARCRPDRQIADALAALTQFASV